MSEQPSVEMFESENRPFTELKALQASYERDGEDLIDARDF